jgi:ribosomal protein S18 acetylase RimI-like enzyme
MWPTTPSALRSEKPESPRIRRGSLEDEEFVCAVGVKVFARLGDYRAVLPSWLSSRGVLTHIAEDDLGPVGFTMLSCYPAEEGQIIADLLAIAVAPTAQHRGVGRTLLRHAITQVMSLRAKPTISEIRLSVAEDNWSARRLFESHGFHFIPGEHGYYDGGQRALHMTLPLSIA